MQKLFIYFSASGNGDYLAELFKEKGYTPVKVEMVRPIKKVNFWTIFIYGARASFNKCDKIKPLNLKINQGDDIVIGSPIWADKLSTPINQLLKEVDFNKNDTEFVLYPAGEGTKKSLLQLEKLGFKMPPIVISNPKKNIENAKKLVNDNF